MPRVLLVTIVRFPSLVRGIKRKLLWIIPLGIQLGKILVITKRLPSSSFSAKNKIKTRPIKIRICDLVFIYAHQDRAEMFNNIKISPLLKIKYLNKY